MNWWDVEYSVIGPSTAFDAPRPRNVASPHDRRARREREPFPDHRLRRTSFTPPVDADGTIIAERFTRMDIYARDGGICQLCLEPVDFDALYGPEVLSIDHIDREGPHTRANCRLTHQFCNNDAQWANGFDPELARARLHHKVATNEKVDPSADHFPRRSPITGHVVSYEERLQQEFAAADMAQAIDTPPPPRTATKRLAATIRSLFRRG